METETNPIERVAEIISEYESGAYLQLETVRELRRELAISYYHITTLNIESYKQWNEIVYKRGDASVASATTKADYEVPELRETRKLMEAIKHVLNEMQQEISILKLENN